MRIALIGNPNSGKTTLFNRLTGSNQHVGNWPGVTVEKKEGQLKGNKEVKIVDLPGIYSLSPYTLEEVISRDYLVEEKPDAILNIVDGTNLERNLYLTTQAIETGIPLVLAVNMADIMEKEGYKLDIDKLSKKIGVEVVKISALNGHGCSEAAEAAVKAAEKKPKANFEKFSDSTEDLIKYIEGKLPTSISTGQKRWFAIKVFERDEKILEKINFTPLSKDIEDKIKALEEKEDDDSQSIIASSRYEEIARIIDGSYINTKNAVESITTKIDKVVTNRFLALPIFALIMYMVYYFSIITVGTMATDFVNDNIFGEGFFLGSGKAEYTVESKKFNLASEKIKAFEESAEKANVEAEKAKDLVAKLDVRDDEGEVEETLDVDYNQYLSAKELVEPDPNDFGRWVPGIPVLVGKGLDALNVNDGLKSLVLDGIIAGVGSVLGFLPQMFVLFICLSILEACGYMSRIAFIMDRIFRKFGLSGKSFIPMLISTGCAVPGVMATRTIENERDRRMTIITSPFMPCSAKLPIIALMAGAIFNKQGWVAPSVYFLGIASVVISGIILKKTELFAGDPAPFVMELPDYKLPRLSFIWASTKERCGSFVKKAGTLILLATIVIWFASSYGFVDGGIHATDMENSFLASIGSIIAPIFTPLGFGNWKAAVASMTGLIAKENVVATFGVLYGGFEEVADNGWQVWQNVRQAMIPLAGYSFLAFNLLCVPCFAAVGSIKREMGSAKWTWFAVAYQTIYAYIIAMIIYRFGLLITSGEFSIWTVFAGVLLVILMYFLLRPSSSKNRA